MATNDSPKSKQDEADLFTAAMNNPDNIAKVGKYIETGRRWDMTQKDAFGKLLIIRSWKDIKTSYGLRTLITCNVEGKEQKVLFGTETLTDQIREVGQNLPVLGVIRKPGKAFVLTDPTEQEIAEYKRKYSS